MLWPLNVFFYITSYVTDQNIWPARSHWDTLAKLITLFIWETKATGQMSPWKIATRSLVDQNMPYAYECTLSLFLYKHVFEKWSQETLVGDIQCNHSEYQSPNSAFFYTLLLTHINTWCVLCLCKSHGLAHHAKSERFCVYMHKLTVSHFLKRESTLHLIAPPTNASLLHIHHS